MWDLLLDRRPTRRLTLSVTGGAGGYRRAVHPTVTDDQYGRPPLTRRALLLAAAAAPIAALVGGCSGPGEGRGAPTTGPGGHATPTGPTATVDPDAEVRTSAIDSARSLVSAYEAALTAPPLVDLLTPLLAHHRAHLAALGADADPSSTAPAATSPPAASSAPAGPTSPAGSATPSTTQPLQPPDPVATVNALIAAETAASQARVNEAVAVHDGGLARLLGSIAACSRVHVSVLSHGPSAGGLA
jgi:hypothetical protein